MGIRSTGIFLLELARVEDDVCDIEVAEGTLSEMSSDQKVFDVSSVGLDGPVPENGEGVIYSFHDLPDGRYFYREIILHGGPGNEELLNENLTWQKFEVESDLAGILGRRVYTDCFDDSVRLKIKIRVEDNSARKNKILFKVQNREIKLVCRSTTFDSGEC